MIGGSGSDSQLAHVTERHIRRQFAMRGLSCDLHIKLHARSKCRELQDDPKFYSRDRRSITPIVASWVLASRYLEELGPDNYDYVFVLRPDLKFPETVYRKQNIKCAISADKLVELYGGTRSLGVLEAQGLQQRTDFSGLGDYYWLGSTQIIREFFKTVVDSHRSSKQVIPWHEWLRKVVDSRFETQVFPYEDHPEPNSKYVTKYFEPEINRFPATHHETHQQVVEKFRTWGTARGLNQLCEDKHIENHLVAFDLDGTLVNSKEIHQQCLNKALLEVVGKQYVIQDHELPMYEGIPTREKLNRLYQNKKLDVKYFNEINRVKQEYTHQALEASIQPNPTLQAVFKDLKERNNTIVVVTNCVRKTTEVMLEKLGVADLVDEFVCNEDGIRSKPSSDMYDHIIKKRGYSAYQTVIFEDSEAGLSAARSSGASVCEVRDPREINKLMLSRVANFLPIDPALDRTNYIILDNLRPRMNIVIPMSGLGSRFTAAGYADPKPLIPVFDKRMIEVVVENIGIDGRYIFIVQKDHSEKYNLKEILSNLSYDCKIIEIDYTTEGAACTVLLAEEFINNETQLIIANSDQYVEGNIKEFVNSCAGTTDAGILTFKASDPKWSYAKCIDGGDIVSEVAEKEVISDNATVGIYYWRQGQDFVQSAKKMIEKDIRVNNEFYVCPTFNQLIQQGRKVKIHEIDKMWGLGTPEDLEEFLNAHNSAPWTNKRS